MIFTHSPAVFEGLGTTATVATTDPVAVAQAVEAVTREIAAVDASCSRFRPDSELNAVNRAAGKAVAVSGVLIEAVELALRAAALTAGRVVPTVGMAMRVIGYDRDFALVPRTGPAMRITVGPVPPWQMVKVDPVSSTIQLPAAVELDLGATAKAWCADRAAQAASAATGCGVLVSLGGDLATAGPAPDGGWAVRVAEDHAAPFDTPGQTVALRSGGLA
ncbi:MAG TPA: FAD:protein FMN transferase, partial [Acidimicrobiales bacterium]|nr:FAD:protein FMN transferase [Acidimicrobiales bacterium]